MLPSDIKNALQNAEVMKQAFKERLDIMIERERAFMEELEIVPSSSQLGSTIVDQEDDAPLPDEED